MITDLKKIKKLGKIREEENYNFRLFLKMTSPDDLDEIVNQLFEKYSAKIDCIECHNCCNMLEPRVFENDIKQLSKIVNKSIKDFKKEYVFDDNDGIMYFNRTPCPFLKEGKCSIYENRPDDCKGYPYLDKDDFVTRLLGVISNYSICPIVFNVYEDLKDKYQRKDSSW